jgi:hypothetical protein
MMKNYVEHFENNNLFIIHARENGDENYVNFF